MSILGPDNFADVGRKIVNTPEDFPTPVAGISTLKADTIYDLKLGSVTLDFSLRWPEDGNCKLQNGVITYTGSGTLFDTAEMGNNIKRITDITCVFTGGGTLFDLTGTNPIGAFVIDNMLIVAPSSLGTLEGFVYASNAIRMLNFGTGLTLTNMTITDINRLQLLGTNQSTTFLNFTGTVQGSITISNVNATLNTNEYLFDFNTGVTYTGTTVHNVVPILTGSANEDNIFASGSYTQKDPVFHFDGNVYIPDSSASARLGFQDSSTETVIDQIAVPVRINGTYVNGFEERFTSDSDGVMTYTGLETIAVSARAYISIEPVTGINILMGCYIAWTDAATTEVTFTNGTNTVNCSAHGLSNGTSIRFSTGGTLPAEIRDDQFYWIVNAATDTFQVSRTEGGAVYTFTDDGTGTHYYSLGEYIDASEVTTEASTNSSDNIAIEALVEVMTGDKIEVFCDNHDTTSNIIASSINFIATTG